MTRDHRTIKGRLRTNERRNLRPLFARGARTSAQTVGLNHRHNGNNLTRIFVGPIGLIPSGSRKFVLHAGTYRRLANYFVITRNVTIANVGRLGRRVDRRNLLGH